ncbi:MAG: hypothetical protein COU10_02140 [Candidatus Harrisonbacteria bacterium CG10_big_fil_rev_8_21_14_0_10_45_28]|uniref:EamA domain-containing protein n=1 Tax=Candidatus Harrisonbacteria bacterium CG10_big_fil_rev_8_21_14_0_10_45_28 TaxID=1974586 RepID=A0A2H0UN97_9BACT|nr:MAG: hypothetical protein COU10_02140 [Candidatus Harrisonbacteria bacterium CG10_big_fil_rev_8_21_14_0_10_45_28]
MHFSWFVYSITATILFGLSTVVHKLPTMRDYSKTLTAFWSIGTSFLLSLLFFYSYLGLTSQRMLIIALGWGVSFAILRLLHIALLKHMDTNTFFPISTTGSLVLSLLFGFLIFSEKVSPWQGLGIILVIGVIFAFSYGKGKISDHWPLIGMIVFMMTISAVTKILSKVAVDAVDIHSFQIYQYGFGALFAGLILAGRHAKNGKGSAFFGGGMRVGVAIGVLSFFGGYAFLLALVEGPFTLVTSIHSLYILITAITGYVFLKENLTARKIFLIFLAIVAILLIRLG